MHERRAFPRSEVQISGKVVAPDMSCFVGCVIKDLSEDGALVATYEPARVPHRAFLWQARTGTFFECDVRWRKSDQLFGLHFVDPAGRARRRALIEATPRDARSHLRVASSRVPFESDARWRKSDQLFGLHFADPAGRARRRALIEATPRDARSHLRVVSSGVHSAA